MTEGDRALKMEAVEQLPFVGMAHDGNLDLWSVRPSGHVPADLRLGESYARLAIEVSRTFDLPVLIAFVLQDIMKSGRFTGVEAGFIAVIASAARAGSMN